MYMSKINDYYQNEKQIGDNYLNNIFEPLLNEENKIIRHVFYDVYYNYNYDVKRRKKNIKKDFYKIYKCATFIFLIKDLYFKKEKGFRYTDINNYLKENYDMIKETYIRKEYVFYYIAFIYNHYSYLEMILDNDKELIKVYEFIIKTFFYIVTYKGENRNFYLQLIPMKYKNNENNYFFMPIFNTENAIKINIIYEKYYFEFLKKNFEEDYNKIIMEYNLQ